MVYILWSFEAGRFFLTHGIMINLRYLEMYLTIIAFISLTITFTFWNSILKFIYRYTQLKIEVQKAYQGPVDDLYDGFWWHFSFEIYFLMLRISDDASKYEKM